MSPAPLSGADPARKILSRDELLARRRQARADGRRVAQCHGCFDIVHPGHIRHLRFARAQGDILLVSITGDETMAKGDGRPLIPEELRAENLAALDVVDWVFVERRPTAAELLGEVQPDVYVKGREYESNDDPRFAAERLAVEQAGGRVVFSSGDVVFSSSALIRAMEASADPFHARLADLARREDLRVSRLSEVVSAFRNRRILVVGETILDTYVFCDRPAVAGESPVLTLRPLEKRHYDGGAAIIARHAAAMGARPVLVTPLPRSARGAEIRTRLLAEGVDVRALEVETPLPEKQRFLVGPQKVVKVDLVEPIVLDVGARSRLLGLVRDAASDAGGCHAAVFADFALGLFTPRSFRDLCRAVRGRAGVTVGDVSGRKASLLAMTGLDLLCPSEEEMREAMSDFDQSLPAVAWRLLQQTRAGAAFVTLGADGLVAFQRAGEGARPGGGWRHRLHGEHIPALSPVAVDPLGCGDALVCAASLALACGGSHLAAAFLGSVAAAQHAQRLGNTPVSATDLRLGIARVHSATLTWAGDAPFQTPLVEPKDAPVARAS
jgi:rfaE bifunctional protein nucleotidyltransferase chain/domain